MPAFHAFFSAFFLGRGAGLRSLPLGLLRLASPFAGKRPIPYARIGNRMILEDREWADFLCEDRELVVYSAFIDQCLGIGFTFTDFDFGHFGEVEHVTF